jgi:hypothetical protein
MTRSIRLLPIVLALLISCAASAFGQGFYYNYYLDGSYIGTDDTAYAGSGYCTTQVNISDSLNGNYVSGGATYPNLTTIYNYLAATDGVPYNWTIGISIEYPDPFSGNCDTDYLSFSQIIKMTTTYYGPTVTQTNWYVGGIPVGYTCAYPGSYCTSGTPTCRDEAVSFNVGFACPNIARIRYGVTYATPTSQGYCLGGLGADGSGDYPRVCS